MAIKRGDLPLTIDFGLTEWLGKKLNLPEFGVSEAFNSAIYNPKKTTTTSSTTSGTKSQVIPTSTSSPTTSSTSGGTKYTVASDGGSGSNGGSGSGGGEPKLPSLEDLLRDIHRQYEPVLNDINARIEQLPGQQEEMLNILGSNVSAQQGLVQNALEQGQTQLSQNEQKAYESEKDTLRRLADDVRNLLYAGNMRLGAMGASDSSATDMLKYALAKQGNQRTADVVGQTRDIVSEIRNIGTQLQQQAQSKLLEIEQWKADQDMAIRQYINNIRNQLFDARGNVKMDLSQKSVEALVGEYERARAEYDRVNEYYMQLREGLATDYEMRRRNLEDYARQLQLEHQYRGNYVTGYDNLYGLGQTAGQANLQPQFIPFSYNTGEEEENYNNNFLGNIFGR